jgi:hypothetical protein
MILVAHCEFSILKHDENTQIVMCANTVATILPTLSSSYSKPPWNNSAEKRLRMRQPNL